MKKLIQSLIVMLAAVAVQAQTPDIRIKTRIYEKDGPTNSFTLTMGAAPGKDGYADIKCSGGNQSEAEIVTATYNQDNGALLATNVSCQVNEEGIVEVFCDEGVVIDYFCCTGAEITSIEFKNPQDISILALEHNILESLDLTPFTGLQALYLNDNPMNVEPLKDSGSKPGLMIMDIAQIENIDPAFDIVGYPNLVSFDAMGTHGLMKLTPAACPKLQKISIDNTSVAKLDVRNNPELLILNISESRIPSVNLSANVKLQQFYATHQSAYNTDVKLKEIDLSSNTDLFYLFLSGNELTSLDVSKCTKLQDLYVAGNLLTSLDLTQNTNLLNVFCQNNCMDFNTLPVPQETWGDYDLRQRPMGVPSAYLAGSALDLSPRVVRSDAETFVNLFSFSEEQPGIENEVDASLYSFENGVLKVNSVVADSVFATFYNGIFPDMVLRTTSFKVKDAGTFGQPDMVAAMGNILTSGTEIRMHVGIAGATPEAPKAFYVDLGDGNLREFSADGSGTPEEANVVALKPRFGMMKLYMQEGEKLTALKIAGIPLTSLDLSQARQLGELTLTGAGLQKLDLQWNSALRSIDITGNNFKDGFTLAGANGGYGKNLLGHINLSDNQMTSVDLGTSPGAWRYIDLSHNKLSSLNFTDADYVRYLDLSHNNFEYLKINYLGELKDFFCNDNQLNTLVLPETNVIENFNCANNCFTLANIPDRNGLDEQHFVYAPQAVIQIPSKGPGYNLSAQDVDVDGSRTAFAWKTVQGAALAEGTDYDCVGGVTHFGDNTIGKTLYCEMTHPAYPAFTGENVLRTSPMLSAGMPTHLLGSFTTTEASEARLSIASAQSDKALYIDWTGTESLEQYPLATTYTVYNPLTTEGADVKVWSYDEDDQLTVFSLSGVSLANVDLSPMKSLRSLSLSGSGISDMVWPQSPQLGELSLEGCAFSDFDFSRYPNLYFVNFDRNNFKSVDLSGLGKLGTAGFAGNGLEKITLKGNGSLWMLGLSDNCLEELDLGGAPNIEQLFANNNRLSAVDLDGLSSLRVLYLDNNRFDFSNLPVPRSQWVLYTYGNQPELKIQCTDGKVDLSGQAVRDGVETVYTWFYDTPVYDSDEGTVSGEELIEGEEYSVEGGITTFHEDIDKVCCVLTNSLFPKTFLVTNIISVEAATGIQSALAGASALCVSVDGRDISVSGAGDGEVLTVCSAAGAVVGRCRSVGGKAALSVPGAGVYVLKGNAASVKINVR